MSLSAKNIMNNLFMQNSTILKEINKEDRIKLQDTLLTILKDILKVCYENNIKIVLVGGSALGAVRHSGFIPWDDDLDLAIRRKDLIQFKKCFELYLSEKYVMEAPNYGEKDCKNTWIKIYLKDSIFEEIHDLNTPYCKGIFVDIFVCENVSKNALVKYFDSVISDIMKGIATSLILFNYPNDYLKKLMNTTLKGRIYYFLRKSIGFMFSWISHKRFCSMYDKFVSRHNECDFITIPVGRKNYLGEIIPISYWDNLIPISFEGLNCFVYKEVHSYLLQLYGSDYMQIPPYNKRESHFIVNLKFPQE